MLVGRAECFLVGRPDLDETITRLKAYASAGADCLYAPGGGGALARVAWGSFMRAAQEIATEGRFDAFATAVPMAEINGFFHDDLKGRAVAA